MKQLKLALIFCIVQSLQSYLPENVQDFVGKTIDNGARIMAEFYEDIEREVLSKVSGNMEDFASAYEFMVDQMLELYQKYQEMSK